MRKLGMIAAIVGFGLLGLDLVLRSHVNLSPWAWLPGAVLLSGGSTLLFLSLWASAAPAASAPKISSPPGPDTARLLDNFEQRFAELKGRKGSTTVLGDLYALGTQLEQRGRGTQATAVYRHLARIDNTYRDVGARLRRLMDAERAASKALPASTGSPIGAKPPSRTAPRPATPAAPPPRTASGAGPATAAGDGSGAASNGELRRLGRYQLEREIGRGAMGVVYLGRDTAINRLVAIKAIPLASEFSESELTEARTRFFREAENCGPSQPPEYRYHL